MHWTEFIISYTDELQKETSVAALYALGCVGIEERESELVAYMPDDVSPDDVTAAVAAGGAEVRSHLCLDEQDWLAAWKVTIGPYRAGGLLICPPWKLDECEASPCETRVIIDPGQAFGEGSHPTTATVLELMRGRMQTGVPSGARFLDLGTGTGILSIAAYVLGFRDITALDIEPRAVETARQNFGHNGIKDKVRLKQGGIGFAEGEYDLIVANIFLEVLLDYIPKAARLLAPGGALITSGILLDQFDAINEAALGSGLALAQRRDMDGWVSAVFATA